MTECRPFIARTHAVAAMLTAFCICFATPAFAQTALGRYHVDPDKITVSGISSGGYMAVQLGVAYSSVFSGVGVFAAGPYGCADTGGTAFSNATRAVGPCMVGHYEMLQRWQCAIGFASCPGTDAPDADASVRLARDKEAAHRIDALSNVSRQRVFLLSGNADKTVDPKVVDALARFYGSFVPPPLIERVKRAGLAHTFPTESFNHGNACAVSDPPFVSDCNYDGAAHVLSYLYPSLDERAGGATVTPIVEFDQRPFFPADANSGMADSGYIHVPASCASGSPRCALHVALHGCRQAAAEIGMAFVEGAGFNRWADTHGVIVLYPQAKKTEGLFSDNPKGCWDWWGYTGAGFDEKGGVQMRAIVAMVERLASPVP